MKRTGFLTYALAALLAASTFGFAPKAQAQDLFSALFGGGGMGSGKSYVSFSKSYSPGTVVVSFGDRRLYYISKRGSAIHIRLRFPKVMHAGPEHQELAKNASIHPGRQPHKCAGKTQNCQPMCQVVTRETL